MFIDVLVVTLGSLLEDIHSDAQVCPRNLSATRPVFLQRLYHSVVEQTHLLGALLPLLAVVVVRPVLSSPFIPVSEKPRETTNHIRLDSE